MVKAMFKYTMSLLNIISKQSEILASKALILYYKFSMSVNKLDKKKKIEIRIGVSTVLVLVLLMLVYNKAI